MWSAQSKRVSNLRKRWSQPIPVAGNWQVWRWCDTKFNATHSHKATQSCTHNGLCVQDSWVHVATIHHANPVLLEAVSDFLQHNVLFVIKSLCLMILQDLASCADKSTSFMPKSSLVIFRNMSPWFSLNLLGIYCSAIYHEHDYDTPIPKFFQAIFIIWGRPEKYANILVSWKDFNCIIMALYNIQGTYEYFV